MFSFRCWRRDSAGHPGLLRGGVEPLSLSAFPDVVPPAFASCLVVPATKIAKDSPERDIVARCSPYAAFSGMLVMATRFRQDLRTESNRSPRLLAGCSPKLGNVILTAFALSISSTATKFWRTVCALPTELPVCAERGSNPRHHVVLLAFAVFSKLGRGDEER